MGRNSTNIKGGIIHVVGVIFKWTSVARGSNKVCFNKARGQLLALLRSGLDNGYKRLRHGVVSMLAKDTVCFGRFISMMSGKKTRFDKHMIFFFGQCNKKDCDIVLLNRYNFVISIKSVV